MVVIEGRPNKLGLLEIIINSNPGLEKKPEKVNYMEFEDLEIYKRI